MALKGINIYETRPYVSEFDPDKNNPTIFQIGCLDHIISAYIKDQSAEIERSSSNPGDSVKANICVGRRNLLIVKFGLKGLDNFIDPQTNQPVKFDTISVSVGGRNYKAVADSVLQMIGDVLIEELAEAITKENRLTEDEIKN